jgi:Ser/Thr protein kinase RdoA (MazF antagonist)
LLDRYIPTPPPAAWSAADAIEVARQLAGLHAAFWDRREALAKYTWLRGLRVQAGVEAISQANEAWHTLGRSESFRALFNPGVYRMLEGGLACVPALDATIQAFPPTLCHGDCHLGNVLRDEGGHFLWADWAEVGLGAGPADLSFLIQRANAEGARFSVDTLSAAYHRQLAEAIDRPVSLGAIRRAMDAFELRTRLLEWPHYLACASAETVSTMLGRIDDLIARS